MVLPEGIAAVVPGLIPDTRVKTTLAVGAYR
jgi:hypothetical protein